MNTANKYIKCMFASGLFLLNAPVAALSQLDDQELRQVSGQSLFSLTYVAPSQNGNPHNNIGFYRVGVEADIEINANIRRLALGCDGINGAGRCDIEASNVRFSGFAVGNDANRTPTLDGGPVTDALIRNPFFEVAVLNPNSASTREIAGLRLGFSEFFGMLSVGEFIGTEGDAASQNNPANHTGVRNFSANISAINLNNITIPITVCSGGVNAGRTACQGLLSAPVADGAAVILRDNPTAGAPGDNEFVNAILTRNNSTVTTRGNNTQTFASMQNFGGVDYQRLQLHNVRVQTTNIGGFPINLDLTVNFNEALNFLHQLPIGNDNDGNGNFSTGDTTVPNVYFSLSKLGDINVANTASWLSWQNPAAPTQWKRASRGWSLGVDEFNLGNFTTSRVFVGALEAAATVPITNVDLLQRPVDNCYGALTFC
jgi:hypothetical protein